MIINLNMLKPETVTPQIQDPVSLYWFSNFLFPVHTNDTRHKVDGVCCRGLLLKPAKASVADKWEHARRATVQGSLLEVLAKEMVLVRYVVEDASRLHQLHPVNFNHWHLLEQQVVTWDQKPRVRSDLFLVPQPLKRSSIEWKGTLAP